MLLLPQQTIFQSSFGSSSETSDLTPPKVFPTLTLLNTSLQLCLAPYFLVFSNLIFAWMNTKSPVCVSTLALCKYILRGKLSTNLELLPPARVTICFSYLLSPYKGGKRVNTWLSTLHPQTHPVYPWPVLLIIEEVGVRSRTVGSPCLVSASPVTHVE